jgi:hypothetical protein
LKPPDVAVVVQDDVLELGVALGVERLVGLAEDLFLLGHGVPKGRVAHEHHIENRLCVLNELVLSQNAQLQSFGYRYRAVGGQLVAGQHPHERRLAGAVGTDQTIALPRVQLE